MLLLVIMTVQTQFAAADSLLQLKTSLGSHAQSHLSHEAKHLEHHQDDHQHNHPGEHEHSCHGHYHSHPVVMNSLATPALDPNTLSRPQSLIAEARQIHYLPYRPPIFS